jgi:hypothetical protein
MGSATAGAELAQEVRHSGSCLRTMRNKMLLLLPTAVPILVPPQAVEWGLSIRRVSELG